MSNGTPILEGSSERVFAEIRARKAMPFFEIAAATDIRGEELDNTLQDLKRRDLVTVKGTDPADTIVSISGKYY